MQKKLLIHIGFGKTGTSSLQRFFVLNREKLQSLGFYYPIAGREDLNAHHYMATAVRPGGGTGFDTDVSWEAYLQRLADELEKRHEPTVLISSEIFSGRVIFGKLHKLLALFSEVQVVSYLRRQDILAVSSYNQWVKTEHLTKKFSDLKMLPFYYERILDMWQTTFSASGSINVNIVRPYERGQLYKGDVLDDFMHNILGAELDDTYFYPEKSEENLSLSLDTLEYKRIVNGFCPADIANDILNPLLMYTRNDLTAGKELLSSQQRRDLLAHYAEGNTVVASRYMGRTDGVLFYDAEPSDDPEWAEHTLTLGKAIDISRYILHMKYPGEEAHNVYEIICKALKFKWFTAELPEDEKVLAFNEGVQGINANGSEISEKIESVIRACVYNIYGKFADKLEDDLIAIRWAK